MELHDWSLHGALDLVLEPMIMGVCPLALHMIKQKLKDKAVSTFKSGCFRLWEIVNCIYDIQISIAQVWSSCLYNVMEHFLLYLPFVRRTSGNWWIPLKKTSTTWVVFQLKAVEQIVELSVIYAHVNHCNV